MTGIPLEKLLGNYCHKVLHHSESPCHIHEHSCPIQVSLQTNESFHDTHILCDEAGHKRYAEVNAAPIKDDRGEIIQFVYQIKDITERKRVEEALQFTKFTADHAAVSIAWIGKDGRYLYVNDKKVHYLGYSREELLNMKVQQIDQEEISEGQWERKWVEIKEKKSSTFETCHRTKSGKLIPVEITANYLEYNGSEYQIICQGRLQAWLVVLPSWQRYPGMVPAAPCY